MQSLVASDLAKPGTKTPLAAKRVRDPAAREILHAREALTQAFLDDPMVRYVLPDAARRPAALRWLFGAELRYGVRYGRVHTAADGDAVTVCLAPPNTEMAWGRIIRAGMLAAALALGLRGTTRLLAFMGFIHRMQARLIQAPHWYLLTLGVHPQRQGQGLGSVLLDRTVMEAAVAAFPVYLETTSEMNVRFYARHGFRLLEQAQMPRGGPRVWGMSSLSPSAAPSVH
jgi:GNAT superfamily N-acetyltransferase